MAWYNNWINKSIKSEINDILLQDGDSLIKNEKRTADAVPLIVPELNDLDDIGRKAIIDDPYFSQFNKQHYYKQKSSRLSPKTLKDISVRDWLVSSIIQCRVDTLLRFSRPQHDRFDTGFRIIKKNEDESTSAAEFNEIASLEDFVYNCGRKQGTPLDEKMLFGDFLKLLGRDILTHGHCAIEKVKTRGGALHRLRPLPAESVFLIDSKASKDMIEGQIKATQAHFYQLLSDNDPRKTQKVHDNPLEYYKYVQTTYDGRPCANFGHEDMIFKLFNPQNFADSAGYCYSTLELAIINITTHLNVENYNSNFFTNGYAAKGVLHLKGTVTPAQLTNFRRQFYNSISGQQNAWKTPIIAGLDDVQWVSMAASSREMEYINFNNHVMRILCAQFQIDPLELGLDYLVSGNGRAPQQSSNEYKINYSKERGLLPMLMFFEDLMNSEVLPAIDSKLAEKYKFKFTGYSDDTAQTDIALMQAEMTVWRTQNDLLKHAQKPTLNTPAADLPLNAAFWSLVEKNYTKGEIREFFFNDKGASKRRELAYFPADPAFLSWQQMLVTLDQQHKQLQMQQEQQQEQQQQQQNQNNDQSEDHNANAAENQKAAHATLLASLKDSAKQNKATRATHVGDKIIANPMNKLTE